MSTAMSVDKSPAALIRRLSMGGLDSGSWPAIREICRRTGNNGEPIAPERQELFVRVWIEPYEKILPYWTYVAEQNGTIVGYLTGCPDSKAFNRTKRWRCTLPLLLTLALGAYRRTPGARDLAVQQLGIRKTAEQSFSRRVHRDIARFYPAHLHMNVEREFRRTGIGRRLQASYFADLRRDGVRGIHLFCGADPLPFYLRVGFQMLEKSRFHDVEVFALGQRL